MLYSIILPLIYLVVSEKLINFAKQNARYLC